MEAYPAVQTELRAALRAAFPASEPPSVHQILDTEIPYLDGTCEESFRLAGTSKGNLRQATTDTEILGHRIPKGAEVLLNLHINRAPPPVDDSRRSSSCQAAIAKHGNFLASAAGRDLATFEPRRWLVKNEVTGKESFNAYALPSLAFGGGFRGCFGTHYHTFHMLYLCSYIASRLTTDILTTGRKLATMEFRIVVVLLILNLEFLELPEELKSMAASEKIFRNPQMAFARIRNLTEKSRL